MAPLRFHTQSVIFVRPGELFEKRFVHELHCKCYLKKGIPSDQSLTKRARIVFTLHRSTPFVLQMHLSTGRRYLWRCCPWTAGRGTVQKAMDTSGCPVNQVYVTSNHGYWSVNQVYVTSNHGY